MLAITAGAADDLRQADAGSGPPERLRALSDGVFRGHAHIFQHTKIKPVEMRALTQARFPYLKQIHALFRQNEYGDGKRFGDAATVTQSEGERFQDAAHGISPVQIL